MNTLNGMRDLITSSMVHNVSYDTIAQPDLAARR
jgi:hypothetical protein